MKILMESYLDLKVLATSMIPSMISSPPLPQFKVFSGFKNFPQTF